MVFGEFTPTLATLELYRGKMDSSDFAVVLKLLGICRVNGFQINCRGVGTISTGPEPVTTSSGSAPNANGQILLAGEPSMGSGLMEIVFRFL